MFHTIMRREEFDDILNRYLQGKSTGDEARLLDDFFNSYRKSAKRSRKGLEDDESLKLELFHNIRKKIDEKEVSAPRRKVYPQWLKMAASLVLMIGVGFFAYRVYKEMAQGRAVIQITKTTLRGQKSNITLADGTNVRLNSESTLIFPEKFDKDSREVKLIGEAFFQVTEDPSKPFIITSGDLRTRVLGTSFNISAFKK